MGHSERLQDQRVVCEKFRMLCPSSNCSHQEELSVRLLGEGSPVRLEEQFIWRDKGRGQVWVSMAIIWKNRNKFISCIPEYVGSKYCQPIIISQELFQDKSDNLLYIDSD